MTIIGNMIKSLRTQCKISQTELGKMIGVGKTTISNWETGYSSPDPDSLIKLSNIFNCSVDYIMGRDYRKNHDVPTHDVGAKPINDKDLEKYVAIIEKAKSAKISPERLDKLIDVLINDK